MYFGQNKYCVVPYFPYLITLPFWQALTLFMQLACHHSQSVSSTDTPGVLPGAGMHPLPTDPHLATSQPQALISSGRRGAEAVRQTSHNLDRTMPKAVSQQALPGFQEGWFLSSSGQLKTTQPVFGQEPFQDGKD